VNILLAGILLYKRDQAAEHPCRLKAGDHKKRIPLFYVMLGNFKVPK